MDLLKLVQRLPVAPPIFRDEIVNRYAKSVTLQDAVFSTPIFASKRSGKDGRSLPQAIAHRGHHLVYPENSIRAFEAAVEAGAHAVETDVHLTKDGVVVLAHDPDLMRCFGVDKKIRECDWSFLESLRTVQEPREPVARLRDLLELFRKPEWEKIWLLVDIKVDDDPKELICRVEEIFKQVDPGHGLLWKNKVLLGYWTAPFLPLCLEHFPGYSVANIGFSIIYSRQFLTVPGSGFVTLQASLFSPNGRIFIRQAKANDRRVLSWTVNDEKPMDWCIRQGFDGVITDDVPKFLKICESFAEETTHRWSVKTLLQFAIFNFWILLFGIIIRRRYGSCITIQAETHKNK